MISSVLLAAAIAAGCPEQTRALNSAADVIERTYLDARVAGQIAADVRAWARAGRYSDVCQDRDAFMARFNRDLDVYDGHFHFERPGVEDTGDDWLTAWRAESRKVNAGVREVRVLEGNVGYLRLTSFYPWDLAGPKLKAAFALLAETAGQLAGAFLGPDVTAVQDVDMRGRKEADPLPKLDLPRYSADRRVAVLVDRRSASASALEASSLQAAGRAKVIGSRSGGAAHLLDDPIPVAGGYAIMVPNARPINRTTGGNWEGRGVRPRLPGGGETPP